MEELNLTADKLMVRSTIKDIAQESSYVPIKLSSVGKLGLPAVIHVRDYSYQDVIKLASAESAVGIKKALLDVLDQVIKEDIDLTALTSIDVLEILMTIQGTWYSPVVEFPYFIDETLPKEQLTNKENVSKATISINSLTSIPFPEDKSVPLTVTAPGIELIVDVPRFYHEVVVSNYMEELYAEQDNRMTAIEAKVKAKTHTPAEYETLVKYKEQKSLTEAKALQAIRILKHNGKELQTLKERIECLEKVPYRVWQTTNYYIEHELRFGLNEKVTFVCEVTGKTLTRRFPFRIMDFLPSLELSQTARNGISIC